MHLRAHTLRSTLLLLTAPFSSLFLTVICPFRRRGNLQLALELYRKAETYVPDNIKLKERWILFVIDDLLYKLSSQTR